VTLNSDTIVAFGSIIGGLIGAVAWLFKSMIKTKETRINELVDERDYWREIVLKGASLPEWEAWQQHRHPAPPPGYEHSV
jgi:hypothetical protein